MQSFNVFAEVKFSDYRDYNITKTNENKFIFTKGTKSAILSKKDW